MNARFLVPIPSLLSMFLPQNGSGKRATGVVLPFTVASLSSTKTKQSLKSKVMPQAKLHPVKEGRAQAGTKPLTTIQPLSENENPNQRTKWVPGAPSRSLASTAKNVKRLDTRNLSKCSSAKLISNENSILTENAASFSEQEIQLRNRADAKAFHIPSLGKGRPHERGLIIKGSRVPETLRVDSSAVGRRLQTQEEMAQQDHFNRPCRSTTLPPNHPPRKVLVTRCIQSSCTDGKTSQPCNSRVFDKRGPKSSTAVNASSTLQKSSRIKTEDPLCSKLDPQASKTNAVRQLSNAPPAGKHQLENLWASQHDRKRTKNDAEYLQLVDNSSSMENSCREDNNREMFAEHPDSTTTVLGWKELTISRVAKLESFVSTKEANPEISEKPQRSSEPQHAERKKFVTIPRRTARLNNINEVSKHREKSQERQKTQATNQGKKRKSDELVFNVSCSSKVHSKKAEAEKICSSNTSFHAVQNVVGSSSTSISRAMCTGKHKKFRSGLAQPFKIRPEERGASKQTMDTQQKEPVSSTNATTATESAQARTEKQQELKDVREQRVHRALKMPSFRLPFKPERSTKKLTVPKEPNFHTTQRNTCKHA
eukprot:c21300_g1_i3 orf=184-1971(-)